jgi:hypothetical protein
LLLRKEGSVLDILERFESREKVLHLRKSSGKQRLCSIRWLNYGSILKCSMDFGSVRMEVASYTSGMTKRRGHHF